MKKIAILILLLILVSCGKKVEPLQQTQNLRIPESKGPSGPPSIGEPSVPVPR